MSIIVGHRSSTPMVYLYSDMHNVTVFCGDLRSRCVERLSSYKPTKPTKISIDRHPQKQNNALRKGIFYEPFSLTRRG